VGAWRSRGALLACGGVSRVAGEPSAARTLDENRDDESSGSPRARRRNQTSGISGGGAAVAPDGRRRQALYWPVVARDRRALVVLGAPSWRALGAGLVLMGGSPPDSPAGAGQGAHTRARFQLGVRRARRGHEPRPWCGRSLERRPAHRGQLTCQRSCSPPASPLAQGQRRHPAAYRRGHRDLRRSATRRGHHRDPRPRAQDTLGLLAVAVRAQRGGAWSVFRCSATRSAVRVVFGRWRRSHPRHQLGGRAGLATAPMPAIATTTKLARAPVDRPRSNT